MTDKYDITFETWNKVASVYQEKFMDLAIYNESYDMFCEHIIATNPNILEVGCGPGNITRYLLQQRPDLSILATDVAPNMIELARSNVPGAEFRILDCREIARLTGKYDAIMCGFCLPYLSKEDLSKFLEDSKGLLKEHGILYLSAIEGNYDNSGFVTASTGDKAYVYFYEEAYLLKKMKEKGFELIRKMPVSYHPEGGEQSTHLIYLVRSVLDISIKNHG